MGNDNVIKELGNLYTNDASKETCPSRNRWQIEMKGL